MTSKKLKAIKMLMILLVMIFMTGIFYFFRSIYQANNIKHLATSTLKTIQIAVEANPEKHELFSAFYEQAEKLMQTMTLEEKVGQMFLARFPDTDNEVIAEIENFHPGGYILFAKDFRSKTKSSMLEKLTKYQSISKVNLILGVDEEGGTVVRVSAFRAFRSSKFPSPQELWASGGLPTVISDAEEKTDLLKSIGLNMNLAPVADLPTSPSSFIYARSYGQDAKATSEYVSAVVKIMNQNHLISVLKHFPGYGDNIDTHTGIAIDKRSYDTFKTSDFLPFISGIAAGAPCILVNHNIILSMDAERPASLSEIIHNILRRELNFSGIIMTDDLAMDAVKSYAENGEAAVQAVLAGNDMIITSNLAEQHQEILYAIKNGVISESQIDKSVRRILACKYMYGLL